MDSNISTLKEYGRGIIGGLIFSLPLIYTEEMWWTGFIASPYNLIIYILATFLLLIGFNKYSGTRKGGTFLELCHESVEEIGIAFLTSFIFLMLINKINFEMSLMEILGKIVVESMAVAIGISVGTAELGQKNGDEEEEENEQDSEEDQEPESPTQGLLSISVLSICGAILFASPVAPTYEILKIAMVTSPIHQILILVAGLLLSIVIIYYSDFMGSRREEISTYEMILHAIVGFLAAVISSFFLLWFFGRIDGFGLQIVIGQIIVLSIPGIIGACAGRLLIKA